MAIARALALEPRVVICDESVSMLDAEVQAEVLSLLRDLQHQLGLAMIFVTHDLSVASGFCHRVIVLDKGRIVEEGPGDRLFEAPQPRRSCDQSPAGGEAISTPGFRAEEVMAVRQRAGDRRCSDQTPARSAEEAENCSLRIERINEASQTRRQRTRMSIDLRGG